MGRSISVVQPNSSPMMRYDYKMVAVHSANNKWQCCCVALLIFCGFPSENWTVFEENNIICTQIESLFYLLFFRQVVVGLCIFGWLYRLSSYWTKPNKQKGRLFIRWLVHAWSTLCKKNHPNSYVCINRGGRSQARGCLTAPWLAELVRASVEQTYHKPIITSFAIWKSMHTRSVRVYNQSTTVVHYATLSSMEHYLRLIEKKLKHNSQRYSVSSMYCRWSARNTYEYESVSYTHLTLPTKA